MPLIFATWYKFMEMKQYVELTFFLYVLRRLKKGGH